MDLEKEMEQIITRRLEDMPNYEEYMVNSTMKVLVVKDIIALIGNADLQKENKRLMDEIEYLELQLDNPGGLT